MLTPEARVTEPPPVARTSALPPRDSAPVSAPKIELPRPRALTWVPAPTVITPPLALIAALPPVADPAIRLRVSAPACASAVTTAAPLTAIVLPALDSTSAVPPCALITSSDWRPELLTPKSLASTRRSPAIEMSLPPVAERRALSRPTSSRLPEKLLSAPVADAVTAWVPIASMLPVTVASVIAISARTLLSAVLPLKLPLAPEEIVPPSTVRPNTL